MPSTSAMKSVARQPRWRKPLKSASAGALRALRLALLGDHDRVLHAPRRIGSILGRAHMRADHPLDLGAFRRRQPVECRDHHRMAGPGMGECRAECRFRSISALELGAFPRILGHVGNAGAGDLRV